MKEDNNELCKTLEARIRHLIHLHDESKQRIQVLEQELQQKQLEVDNLSERLQNVNADYFNLKTAMTISLNDSDVRMTKQRLSRLVRDVDECIALLGE